MSIPERWLTLALFSLAVMLFLFSAAFAHDHERPELNDWFMHLKSGRSLCCDGSEAVHLNDVEWGTQDKPDSHYWVMIPRNAEEYAKARHGDEVPMIRVDVPDTALVDQENKAGTALVWPMYLQWDVPDVRCFMPGALT